jgi:hypothetical protein
MLRKWRRDDRRRFVGALNGIVFFIALAVLLRQVPWARLHTDWWATTLQLLGAIVAFGGLLWAYIRARYGLGLWELLHLAWERILQWARRLLGKRGRDVVIRPEPPTISFGMGTPTVLLGFGHLDRNLPIEGQLEQLADAIRNLESWFKPIRDDLHDLRHEIEDVRTLAESSAQQALAHIETKIKKLTAELNKSQTLDLRWAIGGLFITAVGTFVSYWA